MGVGAFLCNEKWYQSLPEDLREAVVETEKIARRTYEGVGHRLDTEALEKLKTYGMQVHSHTPEQKRMFIEKARPYVRRWMEEEHGKEFVAEFFAAIKAAEEQEEEQAESAELSELQQRAESLVLVQR